jgi:hypothetical protein
MRERRPAMPDKARPLVQHDRFLNRDHWRFVKKGVK